MDATLAPPLLAQFRRRSLFALGVPVLVLLYLVYAVFAFDLPGLPARFRPDNAKVLLSGFVSYRVAVIRDNRSGAVQTTMGGDPRNVYPPALMPDWVTTTPGTRTGPAQTRIDLGRGHVVTYDSTGAQYDVPGYGTIRVTPTTTGTLQVSAPEPRPHWLSVSDTRVSATTWQGRFIYTRGKVETDRSFWGWGQFFFTLDSPFAGKGPGELAALALWEPRLDPAMPNAEAILEAFWHNRVWHHDQVAGAMFETVLMALLGTMSAALVALPLAFMAASNMMPLGAIRFALRRVFDFIRSTDALIWTLILARAFGPGPMTGSFAILMTDTGAFGKLFSEAIENIDEKQVEGIRATGAGRIQRARFGVLPQIMPVLLSQVLYSLESNTRSATVIGAIVGGGIGLLLTQAIQTQKDWDVVAYYLVLIVVMVIAMDWLSGWLRRRMIKGTDK